MATNTGIEVTALRPQAQAGDFYVRPDQTSTGIEEGLARLANTKSKQQQILDRAKAEELAISDSFNGSNIHNMDAYAHHSKAVQSHLKELRGRTSGYNYKRENEIAYNEWRLQSSETGEDFPEWMAERKAKFAQTLGDDRFLIAGAMGAMNESEQNLNAIHNSFLHTRVREETKRGVLDNVDYYVSEMGNSLSLIDIVSQIDDAVVTADMTGGMSKSEGNQLVFEHVLEMYKDTGNDNYRLLANNLRYAVGTGKTLNSKARQAINSAMEHVQYEEDKRVASQEKEAAAALEQAKKDAWATVNNKWLENPSYNITKEETKALLDAGVSINSINSVRDNWAASNDKPYTEEHTVRSAELRAQIQNSMFNPSGNTITSEMILAEMVVGEIHPKDVSGLLSYLASAEQATPLLQSPTVRERRTVLVDELKQAFYGISSPANAAIVRATTERFDKAFVSLINKHYANPAAGRPTESELNAYADQAMESTEQKASEETAKVAEQNEKQSNYNKAVEDSKKRLSFLGVDDTDEEFVGKVLNTSAGERLHRLIQEDPFQLVPYEVPAYQDQFGSRPAETINIPAHQALERLMKDLPGGGRGGFYFYNEYLKNQVR